MSRPVGAAGLALIRRFEGCRLTAYKPFPSEACWTIGWGHYGPDVREGQTITQAEADALLLRDCQRFADAVDDPACCPLTDRLNSNQRDALISFTYNCGEGCLRTLCKNRSIAQIAATLPLYNRGGGGKVLAGLTRRRAAERALFETSVETEDDVIRYQNLNDIPEGLYRETIKTLMDAGLVKGRADGTLDLSVDMIRALVIAYRGGAFDRKLLAAGMEPSVP